MDIHSLGDMVNGGLHSPQLGGLNIQQLEHIVCQGIYLVSNTCKGLGCICFCFFQGLSLVLGLDIVGLAVIGHATQVLVTLYQRPLAGGDFLLE